MSDLDSTENASPATITDATAHFPPAFADFLKSNHIDPEIYQKHKQLPRYVRILRYAERTEAKVRDIIKQIQSDAQCPVAQVAHVPGFLAISDQTVKLSQIQASANGDIIGMDVSSGIAAIALSVEPGNNVLDLCCAPGVKLVYLAEILSSKSVDNKGSVTGVDIASHRAATCRSLVRKHAGDGKGIVRIFVQDGTSFDTRAPRNRWWDPQAIKKAAKTEPTLSKAAKKPHSNSRKRQRLDTNHPWFAPQLLATWYANSGTELYDRVLVDAECTHDGSLAHVQKYERWGWEQLESQVVGDNRPQSVPVLQSRLLENGWRLLKENGILVYSTCSLSRYQNEYVIGGLLKRHDEREACVESVDDILGPYGPTTTTDDDSVCSVALSPSWVPQSEEEWAECGHEKKLFERMRGAARLDPMVSNTSGMFIVRIRKLSQCKTVFDDSEIIPLATPSPSLPAQ